MTIKGFEEENMKLKAIIESGIIENIEDIDIFTMDMSRIPVKRGLDYDVIKIYSNNGTTCIVTSKTREEDDKEVTDEKMMEYALAIKKHCDGMSCEDCVFLNTDRELCKLTSKCMPPMTYMPYEWDIGEEESK